MTKEQKMERLSKATNEEVVDQFAWAVSRMNSDNIAMQIAGRWRRRFCADKGRTIKKDGGKGGEKMTRLLLLDVTRNDVREVQINEENGLNDYYDYLNCDTFDIARRMIGGKPYDIFVDDIGLWRENIIVSAVTSEHEPALVGNLLIANHDGHGNTTSLSDEDIAHIRNNIGMALYPDKKMAIRMCLLNCD